MRPSIRRRLSTAFILLATIPLILAGTLLAWQGYLAQRQLALGLQAELARRVAAQVLSFLESQESQVRLACRAPALAQLVLARQRAVLSRLLAFQRNLEELALLDFEGNERLVLLQRDLNPQSLGTRRTLDEFILPTTTGTTYCSPVRFDDETGEPYLRLGIPMTDPRTGQVEGVLVARTRWKAIWDLIAGLQLLPGQRVFLVDRTGAVVAHLDPSVVLRGTRFDPPATAGIYPGLDGSRAILGTAVVRFAGQDFAVVAEQAASQALAPAIRSVGLAFLLLVLTLAIAAALGWHIVRPIIHPIEAMADAARAISAGDYTRRVSVTRPDELGVLARAFNDMIGRLQSAIRDLEGQVEATQKAQEAQEKLHEQLRRSQRLESIGRLAGGVAHDFNNLLVPIMGYAEYAQLDLPPESPVHSHLDQIRLAAERAAGLTRQLLAFGRRQILEVRVLDLNDLISGFREMLRRLISEDIRLQLHLAPIACPLRADRTQIEQILLNLCINASDAMPGGGVLMIETDNVFLDEAYASTHPGTQPGNYVMLSISDTGQGMDAETRQRIFEPFFTTKPQGKGTGLGLATVFGIVQQHQGSIWLYSEPGQGTTFKVYLPRSEASPQPLAPPASLEMPLHGSETILVVEDEPMVRNLACETLAAYGYRVLEATDPGHAVEVATRHEKPMHLLLTDVIMPGMNGRQLYNALAATRPDLKVLYMSGYTGNVIVHHGVLDEGVHFLQKPFAIRHLVQRVRQVLG